MRRCGNGVTQKCHCRAIIAICESLFPRFIFVLEYRGNIISDELLLVQSTPAVTLISNMK